MKLGQWFGRCALAILVSSVVLLGLATGAIAGLDDDNFDGNIFALYGGNGSLVPPSVKLSEAYERRDRATLIVFYLDDSRDCKRYSTLVSKLQAYYGRAADILPIDVDTIRPKATYAPDEAGYYWHGRVPQTVVLNQANEVVFDRDGQVPFEDTDDALREVFDLLPRSESVELKRRSFNEVNAELEATTED